MRAFITKVAYALLRMKYRIMSPQAIIEPGVRIKPNSVLEGRNKICRNAYLNGELGFASYIGDNSAVIGKTGKYVSIAANVNFIDATHPINRVSTHPAFYSLKKQVGFTYVNEQLVDERPKYSGSDYSIIVGNDVYIGFGATIIGPVKIGDGAVIAANSTVTKDVSPYTVVGGVPAKEIKKRFSDDDIEFLEALQWWDKDTGWLKERASSFSSVAQLKDSVSKDDN